MGRLGRLSRTCLLYRASNRQKTQDFLKADCKPQAYDSTVKGLPGPLVPLSLRRCCLGPVNHSVTRLAPVWEPLHRFIRTRWR
jgi:hypothetical protein